MSHLRSCVVAMVLALALDPAYAASALCPAVPSPSCREAPTAKLKLNRGSTPDRDKIRWSWRNKAGTTFADFGDPTVGTSYALCVYDGSAAAQPVLSADAPAHSECTFEECWEVYAANTVYLFVDGRHAVSALSQLKLKSPPGGTNLQARGGGVLLGRPALPFTLPVRVQLRNSDTATCWESNFSSASRNDAQIFKATIAER